MMEVSTLALTWLTEDELEAVNSKAKGGRWPKEAETSLEAGNLRSEDGR